jgi:hypothetical protein
MSSTALAMHISGLKQVVALRGGLEAIRTSSPMAANITFWISMISINEPALLPLSYGDLATPRPTWYYEREVPPLHTHSGSLVDLKAFGVDAATAGILHEVQCLSRMYTATVDYGTPAEAAGVMSHLCSIIDRLLQMSRLPSTDSPVPGLSQSCRLAGCLHVLTPMTVSYFSLVQASFAQTDNHGETLTVPTQGYFPNPTLLLHNLTLSLKTSLSQVFSSLSNMNNHLLLWLLSVGGITAHSMVPERAWFVGHLVVAVTDLDIKSWEAFRRYLVQLAFHDNFCNTSFASLWKEVWRKKGRVGCCSWR